MISEMQRVPVHAVDRPAVASARLPPGMMMGKRIRRTSGIARMSAPQKIREKMSKPPSKACPKV